jgi:hypothetical protein
MMTVKPLVTIQFSDETRMYIMDQGLEVAKAMIQAGYPGRPPRLAEQAEGVEMPKANPPRVQFPHGLHPDGEREEDRARGQRARHQSRTRPALALSAAAYESRR